MSFQTKGNTISPKGGKQTQNKVQKAKCFFTAKRVNIILNESSAERELSEKLRQFKENHSIVRYIIQEVQANKSVR